MKEKPLVKSIGKVLWIVLLIFQTSDAMVRFISKEKLVGISEYIVIAKIENVSDAEKTFHYREVEATVIKNELQVMESIKGVWELKKQLILNTLKFDKRMEDNVELPLVNSKVLLFLKRDEKGELKPVNGIQGVWYMNNGEFTRIGNGTTLKQMREMVQNQQDVYSSRVFTGFLDTAEIQTQTGHYKEALETYRKAYDIYPMRDLEDQMAWLMGEVGHE